MHRTFSYVSGVPLSTQWGPQGYFYPIQIAQYGLSHYSKNLTEKPPHVEVYETAEEREQGSPSGKWMVPKGCLVTTLLDKSRFTNVKQFVVPGESSGQQVAFPLGKVRHSWSMALILEAQKARGMYSVLDDVPGRHFSSAHPVPKSLNCHEIDVCTQKHTWDCQNLPI